MTASCLTGTCLHCILSLAARKFMEANPGYPPEMAIGDVTALLSAMIAQAYSEASQKQAIDCVLAALKETVARYTKEDVKNSLSLELPPTPQRH